MQITTLVLAALLSSGEPAERFNVRENSTAGTIVGTVQAGKRGQKTFAITSGNESGAFRINAETGQISLTDDAKLDFEQRREFPLSVTITRPASIKDDLAEGFAEALKKSGVKRSAKNADVRAVLVVVTDANERPTIADQSLQTAENRGTDTVIGRIHATDPDANEDLFFAMLGDEVKDILKIDPATGVLTLRAGATLDFESRRNFEFDVAVIDHAGLIETAHVNLKLTNVNEPPQLTSQSWSLPENSAQETVVGRVNVTDPDEGDTARYEIVGGNDNGSLAINAKTGEITVRDSSLLDFETAGEYLLWVAVTDSSGATSTAEYPIQLTNSNESPVAAAESFELPDDYQDGTVVGRVTASDPDQDDALTFAITGGAAAGAFEIDATSGELRLADAEKLQSVTADNATLDVTITDREGASSTIQASINLEAVARRAFAVAMAEQKASEQAETTKAVASTVTAPTVRTDSSWSGSAMSYGGWLFAALVGCGWVMSQKKTKRREKRRRQTLKTLEREQEQLQERLQELDGHQAELVAEKNEVLAVQTMLTREFEKLRKLLAEYQGELKSTDSVLLETHELLIEGATSVTDQTKNIASTGKETPNAEFSEFLGTVQRDLTAQRQRLDSLQDSMVKRDRDLGATCSAMDARLEEIMERVAAANSTDDGDLFQIEEDLQSPDSSNSDEVTGVTVPDSNTSPEQVAETIQEVGNTSLTQKVPAAAPPAEESDDDDTAFLGQSDRWAARTEMDTLRAVANKSAKSALASHARKTLWKTKLLLGAMAGMSFVAAVCLLSGGLGDSVALETCGWGAAGIGAISVVHLVQKVMQTR